MELQAPDFRGRKPEEIVSDRLYFDSAGYIFRALSWLDLAKRERNVCAIQYSALETRQAIEQLMFEELVLSVATELDRAEYEKCKGESTKLYKIIGRLNPDYEKLEKFAQAIMSIERHTPKIITWDHKKLMKYWGQVSNLLHWGGEPKETVESERWFQQAISVISEAAGYMWGQMSSGYSGIMMPKDMHPEIRAVWERFKAGESDIEGVKTSANLLKPMLRGG